MLIIIDEPNQDLGGGALCAPIAAEVIEEAMNVLGIEPKYDEDEVKSLSSYAPNVVGKSLDNAKTEIDQYGLNCVVIGKGDKVTRQCPTSAGTIPGGGTVYVYTDDTEKKMTKVPDFTGLTVAEAKNLAKTNNLNIQISGNDLTNGSLVASRQSDDKGSSVEQGTVITVTFKSTESVLD